MITLYQLHWSHFVEKVRWALDYKGLEWSAIDVDPFTKRQMRHLKCSLLRPTMLVPYFRNHPRLQGLLEWRQRQLQEHGREGQVGYESALDDIRRRRGWALGRIKWLDGRGHDGVVPAEIPTVEVARNDQQSLGRWPVVKGPFWYLRLRATCGLERTAYP